MGILYSICFFVSIFILLNLALFIYNKINKFREGFVCEGIHKDFLPLDPLNDNKNIEYLDDAKFGPELAGNKIECDNCTEKNKKESIGSIISLTSGESAEWDCGGYKEKAEQDWDGEYTEDFKRAVKIGCEFSLCNKIKNDPFISDFGLNKKQQKDIEDLNNIITQDHGELNPFYNTPKETIWRLDGGNFFTHGEDKKTKWQPTTDTTQTYFSQTTGVGNEETLFKGMVNGKDKLLAWTNKSGDSKLFTCTKPCDGTTGHLWDYDSKTVKPPNDNPSFYNILDMTSDNRYNWMIDKSMNNNKLRKKLNNSENYINVDNDNYKNFFDGNTTQRKQMKNVYWKTIDSTHNPVQITNNKLYVIILSHSGNSSGIYICKKPCTGKIYNWYKILDDINKKITFIHGDINENWIWYIKGGELWKIKITTEPPTQKPTPDVYKTKTNNFKASINQKIIIMKDGVSKSEKIEKVYGRDEKYLWVIFEGDTNIYGVDRNNNTIKETISGGSFSSNNFIVENHPDNIEKQKKCGEHFDRAKCRDKTKNESSEVKDAYCKYPDCGDHDLKTCCTLNQTCAQAKQNGNDFCTIEQTNENLGFKTGDLTELYCAGPTCKKLKDNGTPHGDILSCCNPLNKSCKVKTNRKSTGKYSTVQLDNLGIPKWEINKYKNKFDLFFNKWENRLTGGKYQKITESFVANQRGKNIFNKTKVPEITNWSTIDQNIKTKLAPLDNLSVDVNKKTTFLQNLLQQGGNTDYDSLDPGFKMKKTCTGWDSYIDGNICTGNKELSTTSLEFYDGQGGKEISKTGDHQVSATKSFCCGCGANKWDDGNTCVDCGTVTDADSEATYTCSNADNSRVSACSTGYWKNEAGTADKCVKCGEVTGAFSGATYTCSNADNSRVSACSTGYWKNGTGTADTCVKCGEVTDAVSGATYTCSNADNSRVSACSTGYYKKVGDPITADKCKVCGKVDNAATVTCTYGKSSQVASCNTGYKLKNNSCIEKAGFRNREGFSGFSRNDWTNAQNYMNATNDNEQANINWDQPEKKNFIKGVKTWSAGTFDIDNIPCTHHFDNTGYSDDSWQYKAGNKKYCPAFKPTCDTNICTGDEPQPKLVSKIDIDNLNIKVDDDKLTENGYCTGIFSYCDGMEKQCKLEQIGDTWDVAQQQDRTYRAIINYAQENNKPLSSSIPTRKNAVKTPCSSNTDCLADWKCVDNYCIKKNAGSVESGGIAVGGHIIRPGITALGEEQEKIRDLYLSGEKKIKENNDKFLTGGISVSHLKGGIKGKLLNLKDTKEVIDVLKTKYVWYFKLPKDIVEALSRLPHLDKINIGFKKKIKDTVNSTDFKNAKGDIKISYNKKVIEKYLLKLSKRTETVVINGRSVVKKYSYIGEEEEINDEVIFPWIEKRTFKSTDSCTRGKNPHCTGDLTLKDLDTTQKPWGYKSRKAFKKKASGTSDSWNKLGDTSDVGKHLYGNTGVRNIFNTVNPHPHQNDFIFLNKKN